VGRASITLAEQVRSLLGSHTAGLGQGGITGPVGTDNAGGSASVAREGEPNPATQARGVCTRGRDRGGDFSITQEEGATELFGAKIIMCVMTSYNPKGVRRAKPLIQAARGWHLLPVDVALTTTKDVNIILSLESLKLLHLGVVVWVDRKAVNIPKGQSNMAW